jgi:SAM-dependent methyltransferase
VALELGLNLGEVARRKLARFTNAEVVVADFDQWEVPRASFDVVVAATSFHWLDPSSRAVKCAEILRPGGSLAIIQTRWGVDVGDDDAFFAASQACYARWNSNHDPMSRQTRPEDVPQPCAELAGPGFGDVVHLRYLCPREHSAASYRNLLGTFSDVLAMEERHRIGLLDCVSKLIESRFGGRIVRHDMHDLCIARRAGVELERQDTQH